MSEVTLVRRVCVGTVAAGIAGLTALTLAGPASAASADLDYTCALFSIDIPGGIDPEDLEDELTEELDNGQSLKDAARKAIPQAPEGDTAPEGKAAPSVAAAPTDAPAASDVPDAPDAPDDDLDEGPWSDITPIAEDLPLSARFDTAIADGATTPVGKNVSLEPATARFTVSPELATELSALSVGEGLGGAFLYGGVVESEQEIGIEFDIDDFTLGDGDLTLDGTSAFADDDLAVTKAGTYTYAAGDVDAFFIDEENLSVVGLECALDEGQDATVDQVTAKAAPAPAPTPVRPNVVQTDAAQPTSPAWLPLTAAGLGSILVLGAASVTARRSAAARR